MSSNRSSKPMRVAALFDIHGNLPALAAVLAELRELAVDQIVVGGDVVPGPLPRQCLEALRALPLPCRCIAGNGERDVALARGGGELARVPQAFHGVVHWVARELTSEQATWLAQWPLTLSLRLPACGDVVFCHATPRAVDEVFTRLTPESRLWLAFASVAAPLVVCGHTHMQFDRRIGETRVVNAGSVGMPFGAPGAYWALIGSDGVELRHTAYDLEAAAACIAASGYPGDFSVERPASEEQMLVVLEAAALRA